MHLYNMLHSIVDSPGFDILCSLSEYSISLVFVFTMVDVLGRNKSKSVLLISVSLFWSYLTSWVVDKCSVGCAVDITLKFTSPFSESE